jgi:hypothetical protein
MPEVVMLPQTPRAAWPELDRLARHLHPAQSVTEVLARELGRAVEPGPSTVVERSLDDPVMAELLDARIGADVQDRHWQLRAGGMVVATCAVRVLISSAAITPQVRMGLRGGQELALLDGLGSRRSTVHAARPPDGPSGDWSREILTLHARVDIGGVPVAWCVDSILEAIFHPSHGVPVPGVFRLDVPAHFGVVVPINMTAGRVASKLSTSALVRPGERDELDHARALRATATQRAATAHLRDSLLHWD